MKYMILLYQEGGSTVIRFDSLPDAEAKLKEFERLRGIDGIELLEYRIVDGW